MEVNLTKERITELINLKGLSKVEFAKRLGFERNNLDAYLNSKKKDINFVIKMAEALDMPLTEFLGIQPSENRIYGCLYVDGMPVIVNNREDVERILKEL